mgnify:CR=1 FL=1|jgi:Fic family protein
MSDYFENSFRRIRSFVAKDSCDEPTLELLNLLPDSFDTNEAVDKGVKELEVTDRTIATYLKELKSKGLIRKLKKGSYEKVNLEPSN